MVEVESTPITNRLAVVFPVIANVPSSPEASDEPLMVSLVIGLAVPIPTLPDAVAALKFPDTVPLPMLTLVMLALVDVSVLIVALVAKR